MKGFKYSPWDFVFTCFSLPMFLLDIGLDVWAAVSFYQEKAYLSLGILLFLLIGSSLLVQTYSWLWYSYEDFESRTQAEGCLKRWQYIILHVFQLGIYIRHAGVLESSVKNMCGRNMEGAAIYLSHDLSMLRVIETFSESAPQLVLMLTIMLQDRLDLVTVLKAIGSVSAIAFTVTTYHRSLRSFLPDKQKQLLTSSVVFFFWNLLLLMSRIAALALFASVFPCYIFTHFLCSWLVLFFLAWRSKTDFMDSACGEWLYRATVALIWYFDWFNVVEGETRVRTIFYHGYVLIDISLLVGLWCWRMITDSIAEPYIALIVAIGVPAVYVVGLFFKMIYYKFYHPNICKEELKGDEAALTGKDISSREELQGYTMADEIDFKPEMLSITEEDGSPGPATRSFPEPMLRNAAVGAPQPSQPPVRCNKRMKKLAENFYS